jgi:hypothetical protein
MSEVPEKSCSRPDCRDVTKVTIAPSEAWISTREKDVTSARAFGESRNNYRMKNRLEFDCLNPFVNSIAK